MAVALNLQSSTAHASETSNAPSQKVAAEGLFDEGRKLLESGRLDEACAKLEASQRMDSAVGTLLNLGDCNERRSRLASAWGNYREAASLALTRGDPARAEFARKRGDAVRPKLSMLTVFVPSPEPGLRIAFDGLTLEEAAFNTPLPTDPGTHTLEASAPGKATVTVSVVLVEGGPYAAAVTIAPLAPVGDGGERLPSIPSVARPKERARSGPLRSVGFLGLGASAVALSAASYFALRASAVWSDAKTHCDASNRCDDTGVSLNHDARRNGNVATIGLSLGLAFALFGSLVVLLVPRAGTGTGRSAAASPTAVRAEPAFPSLTRSGSARDIAQLRFDWP